MAQSHAPEIPVAPDYTHEDTLLAALKAGDAAAFAHMVRTHGPTMMATARRLLRDADAAQDALQDAFVSVHRNIESFERRSSLAGWLHRIVTNAALAKLRSRRRASEVSIDAMMPAFDHLGYLIGPSRMSEEPVEHLMHRASVQRLVRQSIEGLPHDYRTILLLRDIEEYNTAEVAELLEISTSAAKVRLHRARLALKKLLEPALQGDLI